MTKKNVFKQCFFLFFLIALTGCASLLNGKVFSELDKDRDGYLSFAEFYEADSKSAEKEKQEAMDDFKKADVNNDNKVSKKEMLNFMKSLKNEDNSDDFIIKDGK